MKTITVPIINEVYKIEEPKDWPLPEEAKEVLPFGNKVDNDFVGWTKNSRMNIVHIKDMIVHNDDGPAFYSKQGNEVRWYKNGDIKKLVERGDEDKTISNHYYDNKEIIISLFANNDYDIIYRKNGKYHRSNGPASISKKNDKLFLYYYINGKQIKTLIFKV